MASPRSRSSRMQSLASLADAEAKELAAQLERQALVVGEGDARHEELKGHLAGYTAEPGQNASANGVSAMQLSETRLFLQRLKEAIAAQAQTVELARSRFEALRAKWIAKHLRTTALGNAVRRFELEEALDTSRREQRMQDEATARSHTGNRKV